MIRKYLSSDRVAVRSKLAQKYDKTAEKEVIEWIEQLTEVKLEAGIYKLGRQIKNGQTLVKLAQRIQKDTPECPEAAKAFLLKLNTDNAPFKQMENIQVFLGFCERYGVPVSGLFHTKDLFDGNNMQQVLACIIQLGTESQRNHFDGPTIGPKPQEKNIRDFSDEKLKASHSFLAMQSGKSGPSLNFQIGAARRIVDSRTEIGKGGKGVTPEVVNGVPDLLDIGKKEKKKQKNLESEENGNKESEDEEEDDEKGTTSPVVKKKPEKKEEESKHEKKRREWRKKQEEEKENNDSADEKGTTFPVVKKKPEKKEEESKHEKKSRERKKEKEEEKDDSDEEEKNQEKKKLSSKQKSVDDSEKKTEETSGKKGSAKKDKGKKDKE